MVKFIQAFTLLVVFIQVSLGQLLVTDASNNCTAELWEFCDQFLLNGGLQCHRNYQIICYHKNQEKNDQEYCSQNATYNCRTFRSKYGYTCNAVSCVVSNNVI
ncbi:hypothetical protein INT46_004341 [Mucor plumbeus]|uniref:Uncharacterized protein n=1 Tax=Mucor plumbeus TaxID=97098 RepID=A0A8H7V181_9FUNG|nr:hypothetical protein INT46_004341 [Mucor plumbeus]